MPSPFLIPNPIPNCEALSCIAVSHHSSTHLGFSFQMPTWNPKHCLTAQRCRYSIPLAIHLVNCICLGRGCECSRMAVFIPHPHTSDCMYSEYTQTILVSSGLFKGSFQLEMLWPHPRRVFRVSVEDRELLPSSSLSLYTYLGLAQPKYQILTHTLCLALLNVIRFTQAHLFHDPFEWHSSLLLCQMHCSACCQLQT